MTISGREIELKLLLPAGPRGVMGLSRLSGVRMTTRQLHTLYFDTPDFQLAQLGVALRVRREGRKWIQTLKTESKSTGGLSHRVELNVQVSGPAIEFELFPAEVDEYVPQVLRGRLGVAFETRFRRRSWLVNGAWNSEIEVALDEGEIVSGGQSEKIEELELELKRGRPDALFALAFDIAKTLPVWPFDLSKAARGARLAKGTPPVPVRSRMPELDRGLSSADAWRVIGVHCLKQFTANLPGIGLGADTEYLHQARVAVRRFRSAYGMFRRGYPLPAALVAELKNLNALLGRARDLDVFCNETLPPLHDALPDEASLGHLADLATRARQQAHQALADYLRTPACGRLLLGLFRHLASGSRHFIAALGEPGLEGFAADKLRKRYGKVKRAIATMQPEAGQRHLLRIAVKQLRYALDSFASLYPAKDTDNVLHTLAAMQDVLGHMNDLAVTGHLLEGIDDHGEAFVTARGLLTGWMAAISLQAERKLSAALKDFSKLKRFWQSRKRQDTTLKKKG